MSLIDQNLPIRMVRPDLVNYPLFDLPEGYSFKMYQPGDEQRWIDIHLLADEYNVVTESRFRENFGWEPARIQQRQIYLLNSRKHFIGTSTAWFDNNVKGQGWGRVHWVAIIPEEQGKGLSKPLLTETFRLLLRYGHSNAFLTTSSLRLPAINLYLKFGFQPDYNNDYDHKLWPEILGALRAM